MRDAGISKLSISMQTAYGELLMAQIDGLKKKKKLHGFLFHMCLIKEIKQQISIDFPNVITSVANRASLILNLFKCLSLTVFQFKSRKFCQSIRFKTLILKRSSVTIELTKDSIAMKISLH